MDGIECINTQFVKLQHDYVEVLTKNYTQHTALDVLGTLQKAGGNVKASPGNPDLTSWSPAKLMESNCAFDKEFVCTGERLLTSQPAKLRYGRAAARLDRIPSFVLSFVRLFVRAVCSALCVGFCAPWLHCWKFSCDFDFTRVHTGMLPGIHASQEGFQIIFEQVYQVYLSNNTKSSSRKPQGQLRRPAAGGK